MSLWWFAAPAVLLFGALVVLLQLRSLHRHGARLQAAAAHLQALRPAVREVHSAARSLAAELREGPHQ